MEDLFESFFSDGNHARAFVMVLVVVVVAAGIWIGRKKLGVVIPLAAVAVLFAAVILPSWDPGRRVARQNECLNNLRIIERAKAKWEEAGDRQPNHVPSESDLFPPDSGAKPTCPSGGTYSLGSFGEKPTCNLEARGHKLE